MTFSIVLVDFNCTIQELKQKYLLDDCQEGFYFNCTIQELKLNKKAFAYYKPNYFNCTIQELKLICYYLIPPSPVIFQLHHTGIKT